MRARVLVAALGLPATAGAEIPPVTLDGRPLADWGEPAVKAAVEAYNARRRLAGLPDALNPQLLVRAEVQALLALVAQPEGAPAEMRLELTAPGLKLFAADG